MMSGVEYNVSTENRFMVSYREEKAREGYQFVDRGKRRMNTGQSDSDRSLFKLFGSENKLNVILDELRAIRTFQDQTNRGMSNFQNSFRCMGLGPNNTESMHFGRDL